VPPPAVQDPKAAADEIALKIEALEQQREALERQAEQQEELADIQNDAREDQQDVVDDQNELAAAAPTDSQAVKLQREARAKFLDGQAKLLAEILAVKDVAGLETARALRAERRMLDHQWNEVTGPRLEAAITLERLTEDANGDEGTAARRELLPRIRALFEEDAAAREAQFQAARASDVREREIDRLVHQFHSGDAP
jgi:hypothetical protein